MAKKLWTRASGASTPGQGGPVYDATIDMHTVGGASPQAMRLSVQRDHYHYGDPATAASELSHFNDPYPNSSAVAIMGLAHERDVLQAATDRTWEAPFPGAYLGATPSFQRSPDTTPVLGGFSHLHFSAHDVEAKRTTRARFGR